jgi:hypothetical protein
LHRRDREGDMPRRDESHPPPASDTGALREPPEPAADHHLDPKIERANYESTHSRSHDSGSLKNDAHVESAVVEAAPTPTNGTATGADKAHKSGELHPPDEADAGAHAPDRPKSDS